MIKYIDGDLVKNAEDFEVILHGCNCQNTMGKGIALQIKEKFPKAYEVDCQTKKGDITKLGTISHTTDTTPIIVNCYTQFKYRKQYEDEALVFVDYKAIKTALEAVKEHFTGKRIGMSKIGSSLGGGDWNVIVKIIEAVLGEEDVTIVNYVKVD